LLLKVLIIHPKGYKHGWFADGYFGLNQRKLVGGATGGWAHCNGWNGINGMELNMFP
jgi:hypothetical protein